MIDRMNICRIWLCLLAFPLFLSAQERKKWTLQECIDYAVRHNLEVRQGENEIEKLKAERSGLKHAFLPEVAGGLSQQFDFGRSLNRSNTYEDSNTRTSSFSLSAELPLFTGFRRTVSIGRNKFDLLAAEADKQRLENTLAKHTGQDVERIRKDIEVDTFLTAPEAKEYGIVDEVLEHRS